jgi:hypothetical protein
MLASIVRPLIESRPATFEVPGSAEEGARLLRNVVRSSFFPPLTRQALLGRVTPSRVSIWRHRPLIQNSFIPVYYGRFLDQDGRTVLTGRFAMHRFTSGFMMFWLLAVVAFLVFAMVKVPFATNPMREKVLFFVVPVLMLAFGLGFVHLGRWFARHDIDYIAREIRLALHAGGT